MELIGPTEPAALAWRRKMKHSHLRRLFRAHCAIVVVGIAVLGCKSQNHGKRSGSDAALRAALPPVSSTPASDPDVVHHVSASELLEIAGEAEKGSVINVWATWCGPCREEIPMLQHLSRELASDGIRVLLVSVDEPDTEAKIAPMLREFGMAPPYYVAKRPLGVFKRLLHSTWPGNVPVTFLFDSSGRRRYFWGGPVMEEEMRPVLARFANGEVVDGEMRFQLAPGKTME